MQLLDARLNLKHEINLRIIQRATQYNGFSETQLRIQELPMLRLKLLFMGPLK